MSANNYIKASLFAGIVFLTTFCGQRGVPSGGLKDETPPKIVKSTPKNFNTNFTGQKITLKFDEYVQVKNFNKEFIISPPVKVKPKYSLSGKKLTIEFDSTLAENTTYSIFLGKAVVDLNEGNVLDSNIYVFSTGKHLDSLELNGKIVDAITGEPLNGIMVHLYKNLTDSAPIKLFPSYFASSKKGEFNFTNLAAGEYKIFALEDANNNFLYDLPNEKIAFLKQEVWVPKDSLTEIKLKLFSPEKTKQKIFKATSPFSGKVIVPFNKAVQDFSINYLSFQPAKDSLIEKWNETKDTLSIYCGQFINFDSLSFSIKCNQEIDDTLKVTFKKKKSFFAATNNYSAITPNNFYTPLTFSFPIPLASHQASGIKIIQEKDTLSPQGLELSEDKMKLKVNFAFAPEKSYQIIVYPKTFKSAFGNVNDTLKYIFKMANKDDYGNLLIKYDLPNTDYVVQLLFKNEVLQQFYPSALKGEIEYKTLVPGEYQLKFIQDENKDGKWTTGNYFLGRQPESSIIYNKPILVRANWDLEISVP